MPAIPGLLGVAAFGGTKFVGYSVAVSALREWEPAITAGAMFRATGNRFSPIPRSAGLAWLPFGDRRSRADRLLLISSGTFRRNEDSGFQ